MKKEVIYTKMGRDQKTGKFSAVKLTAVENGYEIHLLGQFPDLKVYETIQDAEQSIKDNYGIEL